MIRDFLSILAGFALWSVLWCTANFAAMALFPTAFGADGSLSSPGLLIGFVAIAALLSFLSGRLTRRIATKATRSLTILGILLLTVGVLVEAAYWDLLPTWYHLGFLAVLLPPLYLRPGTRAPLSTIRERAASRPL